MIANDVVLGRGGEGFPARPRQSLRLRHRRRVARRRFRRNSEGGADWRALQDFEPYVHLHWRHDRGRSFRGPRRDVHQRYLSGRGDRRGRVAGRSGLESLRNAHRVPCLLGQQFDDHGRYPRGPVRPRRGGRRGHQGCCRLRHRGRRPGAPGGRRQTEERLGIGGERE